MRLENVWKWLDAVDQDHLEPLDQWGVSPLRHPSQIATSETTTVSRGTDMSPSQLKPTPPSGILLRNGSVRLTQQKTKTTAHNDENPPQSPAPGIATSSKALDQRANASTCQPQSSRAKDNNDSVGVKRLPTFRERAHLHNLSEALQPAPAVHVEVRDPAGVNCQGAKVVGGHRQNGFRRLLSLTRTPRRQIADGEGSLHRSNALRRPSNVRAEIKLGSQN